MDDEKIIVLNKKIQKDIKKAISRPKSQKRKELTENNYSPIFKQYINVGEIWGSRNEGNPFQEIPMETQYKIIEVKNKFARFEYIKPSSLKGMISSAPIELILSGNKIQLNKTIYGKIQLNKKTEEINNDGNTGKKN